MTPISLNVPQLIQHPNNVNDFVLIADFVHGPGQVVPRGFVTDMASIPRLFWNIISPFQLGDKGPVWHDWRYRNGLGPRVEADKQFLRDMEEDGIKWWKRQSAYRLVRLWGWRSWNKGKVVIEEFMPNSLAN